MVAAAAVAVAAAAAVVKAVYFVALVALDAEIAAVVEGAQCPTLPP